MVRDLLVTVLRLTGKSVLVRKKHGVNESIGELRQKWH